MELQAVHALYKQGRLIFINPHLAPQDGAEVIVTYVATPRRDAITDTAPIQALRGRGKGEALVEKLLQARREDREHDEYPR